MKPLNIKTRQTYFLKFLLASCIVLGLFGFSIYSKVYVEGDILHKKSMDSEEKLQMEQFLHSANNIIDLHKSSETDTDRSKYTLDLNKLIMDQQDIFSSHALIFNMVGDRYKEALRAEEIIKNIGDDKTSDCVAKIKDLEKLIEKQEDELKEAAKEGKDEEKDLQQLKASLQRISTDVMKVGEDIAGMDWCGGGFACGKGKSEIKADLKVRLRALRNDLLEQAGGL